jgi:phospholipid/cholesterol/gamma-HCH transport system substrate-binding protein
VEPGLSGQARTLLQIRVGIFILVALAVLVGLIYFLGRGAGLFERQYRLVAGFTQIGGLIEGATVRLAGVSVGRVTAIRLPPSGAKVQVELALARRVQERVRADSVARIETLGLLGDKIIEVTLGSPQAPVLPDGGELKTEEPLDTNRLIRQGTELVRNLVDITGDLKTALAGITESGAGADLAQTVRGIRGLVTEIEKGNGLLHRLVYDPQLGAAVADAVADLQRTTRQAASVARRLDGLLGDPQAGGLAGEARRTLTEARQAMERVTRVMKEVEEGKGTLHGLVYDPGLWTTVTDAVEELRRVARQASETVRRVDGLLGDPQVGGLAEEARRTLTEARQAMERVTRVMKEVEEGKGTLHGLVYDPGLWTAMTDAVEDLRRVARQASETVRRVDGLLGDPQVAGLAGEARRTLTEARQAMERVGRVVREVEEGKGLLHALVYGESRLVQDLDGLLGRAGALAARADSLVARVDGLIAGVERGEGAVGVLLRDAEGARAARRLVAAAEDLARGVERARDADGLLKALVFDPEGKAIVADVREMARHFREVTARVARGEGLLGSLTQPGTEGAARQLADGLAGLGRLADSLAGDARLGEALADLRAAMANLKDITGRVEAGEGTLGGLIQDPTVYENLAAFLEGAQRSLLLRTLIRSAIGQGAGGSER